MLVPTDRIAQMHQVVTEEQTLAVVEAAALITLRTQKVATAARE
jgi:hypothetical protein